MGFFSFIETFFFISLAITFILIMMLVYHFKDRLTILEDKCDTMYEIIDNMAKEVNRLHAFCSKPSIPVTPSSVESQIPFRIPSILGNHFVNKIIVSDNESDDDSGSEYSDTTNSDADDDNDEEDVKTNDGIVITESESIQYEDLDEIDDSLNILEVEDIVNEDEVREEKLDETEDVIVPIEPLELDPLVEEPPVEDHVESTESNDPIGQNMDVNTYKKMEVGALKSLVLEKGLATDVKKMKKAELIDLLID